MWILIGFRRFARVAGTCQTLPRPLGAAYCSGREPWPWCWKDASWREAGCAPPPPPPRTQSRLLQLFTPDPANTRSLPHAHSQMCDRGKQRWLRVGVGLLYISLDCARKDRSSSRCHITALSQDDIFKMCVHVRDQSFGKRDSVQRGSHRVRGNLLPKVTICLPCPVHSCEHTHTCMHAHAHARTHIHTCAYISLLQGLLANPDVARNARCALWMWTVCRQQESRHRHDGGAHNARKCKSREALYYSAFSLAMQPSNSFHQTEGWIVFERHITDLVVWTSTAKRFDYFNAFSTDL